MNITLDYIAGFIDGEGCILIGKSNKLRNRLKNNWQLVPDIIITQKKPNILLAIKKVLDSVEIGSHFCAMKNNSIHRLKITGIKRINKFCKLFLPLLICKKEELQIMLDFTEYRLSQTGNKEYTDLDLDFYNKLKEQKSRDFIIN